MPRQQQRVIYNPSVSVRESMARSTEATLNIPLRKRRVLEAERQRLKEIEAHEEAKRCHVIRRRLGLTKSRQTERDDVVAELCGSPVVGAPSQHTNFDDALSPTDTIKSHSSFVAVPEVPPPTTVRPRSTASSRSGRRSPVRQATDTPHSGRRHTTQGHDAVHPLDHGLSPRVTTASGRDSPARGGSEDEGGQRLFSWWKVMVQAEDEYRNIICGATTRLLRVDDTVHGIICSSVTGETGGFTRKVIKRLFDKHGASTSGADSSAMAPQTRPCTLAVDPKNKDSVHSMMQNLSEFAPSFTTYDGVFPPYGYVQLTPHPLNQRPIPMTEGDQFLNVYIRVADAMQKQGRRDQELGGGGDVKDVPKQFVGTWRVSERLHRWRVFRQAVHECLRLGRIPEYFADEVPAPTPPSVFTDAVRADLTESRRNYLFQSRRCRDVVRQVFQQLQTDINGRLMKNSFVVFALDFVNLFMPSFSSIHNIRFAEDEWNCRGCVEKPDFEGFYALVFDYPMLLCFTEFITEDLFCEFWTLVHHRLFVVGQKNTDLYDRFLVSRRLAEDKELKSLPSNRKAACVQKKVEATIRSRERDRRVVQLEREHRRKLRMAAEAEAEAEALRWEQEGKDGGTQRQQPDGGASLKEKLQASSGGFEPVAFALNSRESLVVQWRRAARLRGGSSGESDDDDDETRGASQTDAPAANEIDEEEDIDGLLDFMSEVSDGDLDELPSSDLRDMFQRNVEHQRQAREEQQRRRQAELVTEANNVAAAQAEEFDDDDQASAQDEHGVEGQQRRGPSQEGTVKGVTTPAGSQDDVEEWKERVRHKERLKIHSLPLRGSQQQRVARQQAAFKPSRPSTREQQGAEATTVTPRVHGAKVTVPKYQLDVEKRAAIVNSPFVEYSTAIDPHAREVHDYQCSNVERRMRMPSDEGEPSKLEQRLRERQQHLVASFQKKVEKVPQELPSALGVDVAGEPARPYSGQRQPALGQLSPGGGTSPRSCQSSPRRVKAAESGTTPDLTPREHQQPCFDPDPEDPSGFVGGRPPASRISRLQSATHERPGMNSATKMQLKQRGSAFPRPIPPNRLRTSLPEELIEGKPLQPAATFGIVPKLGIPGNLNCRHIGKDYRLENVLFDRMQRINDMEQLEEDGRQLLINPTTHTEDVAKATKRPKHYYGGVHPGLSLVQMLTTYTRGRENKFLSPPAFFQRHRGSMVKEQATREGVAEEQMQVSGLDWHAMQRRHVIDKSQQGKYKQLSSYFQVGYPESPSQPPIVQPHDERRIEHLVSTAYKPVVESVAMGAEVTSAHHYKDMKYGPQLVQERLERNRVLATPPSFGAAGDSDGAQLQLEPLVGKSMGGKSVVVPQAVSKISNTLNGVWRPHLHDAAKEPPKPSTAGGGARPRKVSASQRK